MFLWSWVSFFVLFPINVSWILFHFGICTECRCISVWATLVCRCRLNIAQTCAGAAIKNRAHEFHIWLIADDVFLGVGQDVTRVFWKPKNIIVDVIVPIIDDFHGLIDMLSQAKLNTVHASQRSIELSYSMFWRNVQIKTINNTISSSSKHNYCTFFNYSC